jgi:2-polyprenyl-3-methyl-5-hydroxy-6-metoxy-1,4-benzoquinol methylase
MMLDDRARWNAKFLSGDAQSAEPDPFLIETCSGLSPGRALDLAGGAGRHAIWLALSGWDVTLTDISDEGLAIASRRATTAGVTITIRRESAAETLAWGTASAPRLTKPFELVTVFWFLMREHFTALPALLSPGGLLLYKTFTADHPRFATGESPHFALHPGELKTTFPTLNTILYREANGIAELAARAE